MITLLIHMHFFIQIRNTVATKIRMYLKGVGGPQSQGHRQLAI